MKRCPQCEFIYEDDQSLCDMDGNALVYEPNTSVAPQKNRVAKLTLCAVVTFIVVSLLCLGYLASPRLLANPETQSSKPETPALDPKPETAPTAQPSIAPATQPSPELPATEPSPRTTVVKANHPTQLPTDSRLTISKRVPPLPRVPPLRRLPPAKVEDEKKPSKVGSFLKKTGRIITKPFKR